MKLVEEGLDLHLRRGEGMQRSLSHGGSTIAAATNRLCFSLRPAR
jgi:hypothetical protein